MKTFLHKKLYDATGAFKLGILTNPLFIFGLVIKLYAGTIFVSKNFTDLFIPFIQYFVTSGFSDPYTYFYAHNLLNVFPYPKLMLYILALPGAIFSPLLPDVVGAIGRSELFVYHLPILAADIVILIILSRWFKNKQREILVLYWLSPLLLYINYLHSQLDVIPIALTFIFLYFLFKERWLISFLFLGAAIATKFHIIIILPFVLVYLYRQTKDLNKLTFCSSIVAGIFLLVNNISLAMPGFQTLVFHNKEQVKLFDLQVVFSSGITLYVLPLAYTILFLHSLTFKRFNRDTFVMFLGFSFGLLILFIPPMPGWYYWIIPFFIYFYIKNDRASKLPYYLLVICYFTYFAFSATSDYLSLFDQIIPTLALYPNLFALLTASGIPAQVVSNLTFTALQAALCINVLWIYRRGVEESKKSKLYNMPYLIGVAGDSGSGKSTLATLLSSVFGAKNLALVAGDAMHKWERGNAMWQKFTHLDPRANQLHSDLEYARTLQNGGDVYRRHYDHHSGTFTVPERLVSKTLVIFEGLHAFFLANMRQTLDLKIFIKPENQLRTHWKLKRDTLERGYTKERVLAQLEARAHDAKEYIDTQEKYADVVFSLKSLSSLTPDTIGTDFEPAVYLEITCDNNMFLEPLLEPLSKYLSIEHTFTDQKQIVSFTGVISGAIIEHLSYPLIPELYDITPNEPAWAKNHDGVMQLFICYYILRTLNYTTSTYVAPVPTKTLLTEIAATARNIGQHRAFVQGGGGNVSIKTDKTTMAVKASGLRLEELQETAGFVGVDYGVVRRFFNGQMLDSTLTTLTTAYEETVAQSRASIAGLPDTALRPSIETGFHAILDTAVIHTHSVYVNILTCCYEGREILADLFPTAAYIPYHTPGATLTFAMSAALKEQPYDTFFLENHGVVVCGRTVAEAERKHTHVNNVIKKWLRNVAIFPDTSITTAPDGILTSEHPSLTAYIRAHSELLTIFPTTILFPDQVVYCKKIGLVGEGTLISIDPETGVVTYQVSYKEALASIETLVAWIYIYAGITAHPLTPQLLSITEGEVITNMESEKYRQKIIA